MAASEEKKEEVKNSAAAGPAVTMPFAEYRELKQKLKTRSRVSGVFALLICACFRFDLSIVRVCVRAVVSAARGPSSCVRRNGRQAGETCAQEPRGQSCWRRFRGVQLDGGPMSCQCAA